MEVWAVSSVDRGSTQTYFSMLHTSWCTVIVDPKVRPLIKQLPFLLSIPSFLDYLTLSKFLTAPFLTVNFAISLAMVRGTRKAIRGRPTLVSNRIPTLIKLAPFPRHRHSLDRSTTREVKEVQVRFENRCHLGRLEARPPVVRTISPISQADLRDFP